MGKMYKQAEWHLYHYREIKDKLRRTQREMEDDAYYSAYGTGDNTPVKSSYTGSKTERAGERLAAAKGKELTAVEQMWIWAIEDVWATYEHEDLAMARLMERAFGLTGEKVHKKNAGRVRDEIMADLFIDRVPTYYAYRQEVINAVIESALEFKAYNKKCKANKKEGQP